MISCGSKLTTSFYFKEILKDVYENRKPAMYLAGTLDADGWIFNSLECSAILKDT